MVPDELICVGVGLVVAYVIFSLFMLCTDED